MVSRTILIIAGLLAATSVLAEAYKWVDEDGVTHYSDVPREGAEIIELSEYTRTTGARLYRAPPQSAGQRDTAPADADEPFKYESLSVTSPGPEETLWNIEGVLSVSLALSPGLQSGHQLRVYFDGQPRLVSGTSFQIEEVWRGVHNIQAEVIDSTGRLMVRSRTNRFYVQQSTVNVRAR
ncbi:MAG TPA: DUF4124 domain-containing protein [Woeseiaceae bacterium]|jgi:hypothetical protein|nr:DUF4124 domain-containing protein [Woeseiaceae bacterium]